MPKLNKQSELLEILIAEVKSLKELILTSLPQPLVGGVKDTVPIPEPTPEPPKQDYPIPFEYRGIVNDVLNKNFEIRLEPQPDSPSFVFTIVVPKEYSSLPQGEDIRPKVIQFSDGVNGVRLWAEKVYNNFSPEVQARIAADRALP